MVFTGTYFSESKVGAFFVLGSNCKRDFSKGALYGSRKKEIAEGTGS